MKKSVVDEPVVELTAFDRNGIYCGTAFLIGVLDVRAGAAHQALLGKWLSRPLDGAENKVCEDASSAEAYLREHGAVTVKCRHAGE